MTADKIAEGLAGVGEHMTDTYYAVDGLYRDAWRTLFAPYLTRGDALAMRDRLARDNPACRYRAIRVETVE